MTTTELDEAKAEEFGGRMVELLNNSLLCLMTSVGHRTGLFDVMATLPPSTSEEVAGKAGLNERYVREWLNAMTVGRFVEYDAANKTYLLPPEHAASLTRAAGPGNLADDDAVRVAHGRRRGRHRRVLPARAAACRTPSSPSSSS